MRQLRTAGVSMSDEARFRAVSVLTAGGLEIRGRSSQIAPYGND